MISDNQTKLEVIFCKGCCCGNPDKGNYILPMEYLEEKYSKDRQDELGIKIVISEDCLGICSPANVAIIKYRDDVVWLHDLRLKKNYQDIMSWAERSVEIKKIAPVPKSLITKKT